MGTHQPYYQNIWQQFRQLKTVRPTRQYHWPDWHQGRERFCFWGVAVSCPELAVQLSECRRQLADCLLPGYSRDEHITVFAAGFMMNRAEKTDETDLEKLQQQTKLIRQAVNKPFELQTGVVNSFAGAPFVEVTDPEGGLAAVRAALLGHFANDRSVPFTPHLTLGFYRRAYPVAEISQRLQAVSLPARRIRVNGLRLFSYATEDIRSALEFEREVIF